jgi:hypothetical protein
MSVGGVASPYTANRTCLLPRNGVRAFAGVRIPVGVTGYICSAWDGPPEPPNVAHGCEVVDRRAVHNRVRVSIVLGGSQGASARTSDALPSFVAERTRVDVPERAPETSTICCIDGDWYIAVL